MLINSQVKAAEQLLLTQIMASSVSVEVQQLLKNVRVLETTNIDLPPSR